MPNPDWEEVEAALLADDPELRRLHERTGLSSRRCDMKWIFGA